MNVQAILERLGVEVVKVRGGEITCRCPLAEHEHEARRPGLSVNEEHGAWICYKGCGSGSLRQLITKVRGGAEAKEILRLADSGLVGTKRLSTNLKAAQEKLAHGPAPARPVVRIPAYDRGRIPGWVNRRGFTADIARTYRLGFSEFYDALVIPVPDAHALMYRANPALDWQERPKYRYTRDFKAHSVLYTRFGFEMVNRTIILVEGPLDCLWLRQQGFSNSMSILGGGTVGIEQRRIIAEIAPEKIVLAFDNDEAGRLTTEKALHWLKRYDCYAVDWTRFGTKTDADGNVLPVKDVAELDLPNLLLMFGSPPLVQAQKIKNPLRDSKRSLTTPASTADTKGADVVKQTIMPGFQSGVAGASPAIRSTPFEVITARPQDFTVAPVTRAEASDFFPQWHYSGSASMGQYIGLFDARGLAGVACFKGLSGGHSKNHLFQLEGLTVRELSRLALRDDCPKNSESIFLGKLFPLLRQQGVDLLVAYSDPRFGHSGVIYKATNWVYFGLSPGHTDNDQYLVDGKPVSVSGLRKLGSRAERRKYLQETYGDRLQKLPYTRKHVFLMPLTRKAHKEIPKLLAKGLDKAVRPVRE